MEVVVEVRQYRMGDVAGREGGDSGNSIHAGFYCIDYDCSERRHPVLFEAEKFGQ